MPLQFNNSEGQVFLGCLGGINYCLFLYCAIPLEFTEFVVLITLIDRQTYFMRAMTTVSDFAGKVYCVHICQVQDNQI